MRIIDHHNNSHPPEPLTIEDFEPGDVVISKYLSENFYIVAVIRGSHYGINLKTGDYLPSDRKVLRKVPAEVHVNL